MKHWVRAILGDPTLWYRSEPVNNLSRVNEFIIERIAYEMESSRVASSGTGDVPFQVDNYLFQVLAVDRSAKLRKRFEGYLSKPGDAKYPTTMACC